MHVLFTTIQISPSPRLISAIRDSTETRIDAVEDGRTLEEPWTKIHLRAPEQFPDTEFADAECADWT